MRVCETVEKEKVKKKKNTDLSFQIKVLLFNGFGLMLINFKPRI